MKKLILLLLLIVLLIPSGYAVVRSGNRIKAEVVLQGGYETIRGGSKQILSFGQSSIIATPVQVSTDSVPVASVTLCASFGNVGLTICGGGDTQATSTDTRGIVLGYDLDGNANADIPCATFNPDNLNQLYCTAVSGDNYINYVYSEY